MENARNVSSEEELLELRDSGKITGDEYRQLLDAMRTSALGDSRKAVNVTRKYVLRAGLGIIIVAAIVSLSIAVFPKAKEHKRLTISQAYWFHSDQRPRSIPANAVPKDDDGHMLFHVDEWFEEMGGARQYRSFLNQADKRFLLKADGYPDVHANAERGCWGREFYIRIPRTEYAKMEAGVIYVVYPVNGTPKYQWTVAPGVTICKTNQR